MSELRVILTEDCGFLTSVSCKQDLEERVRRYAGKGIDAVSWDLAGGDACAYPSTVLETYPWYDRKAGAVGADLAAVLADESHRHGLQFWPAVRMNTQRAATRFKTENPECVLTATTFERPGLLDYESPKVRDLISRACRELVEDYDADGLLLDFIRYWVLFNDDRAASNAPLLTDFMRQVRAMLDEVGERRGRSLSLAAQVLPRVSGCLRYGMDVAAWAQQGIVQYLLPSRSNNTDFNLPVEQFLQAAQGTDCRVFPVLFSATRFPAPPTYSEADVRMTAAMFRTAAHLYYRQGAHGVAAMNLFEVPHDLCGDLRDPQRVAEGPHHYRYSLRDYDNLGNYDASLVHDPTNNGWILSPPLLTLEAPQQFSESGDRFDEHPAEAGGPGRLLQTPQARKQVSFRLADEPKAGSGGVLRFTVADLHPADVLEIDLNGVPIGVGVDGSGLCRWVSERKPGGKLCSYLYEFPLAALPLRSGENTLGLQITSSPPGFGIALRPVTWVQDLEVIMPDGGTAP